MNERILALAEQAGFYVFADRIYIPTISEDITAYQTKFAELIIKECLCYTSPSPHEETEMGRTLAWVDKNVKQHFGVV